MTRANRWPPSPALIARFSRELLDGGDQFEHLSDFDLRLTLIFPELILDPNARDRDLREPSQRTFPEW
jgi:hypothetical protein